MPGLISRVLGGGQPRNADITTSRELAERLRGEQTWSGVDVTPNLALHTSAVFACVRLIAEDIGKLPFILYSSTADGSRVRATSSPFWRLIHDRPNAWQSSQQFREMLTAHALLRGNGFALKNVRGGQVRELIPLHPDRVRIEQLPDWELVYHVQLPGSSEEKRYSRREIFHLPGISFDGVRGVSIIGLARQSIALSMATERHGATFFGKGSHPSGVFRHKGTLSDEAFERLKSDLRGFAGGGTDEGSTLILEDDMDWKQVGLSNEDSQFLATREFQVTEHARWFRVPPHKIADLSRATFSNIEHQAIEYVVDSLLPWGKRWEHAVNQTVIDTNDVYAELLFDMLLRGDTKSRYESYRIASGGPWMSRNEVRRAENLGTVDGLDEVLTPLNTAGGNDRATAEATNAAA